MLSAIASGSNAYANPAVGIHDPFGFLRTSVELWLRSPHLRAFVESNTSLIGRWLLQDAQTFARLTPPCSWWSAMLRAFLEQSFH